MKRRDRSLEHLQLLKRTLATERARADSLVRVLEEELRGDAPDADRASERPGDRDLADDVTRAKARQLLARTGRGKGRR
ncbi:MAG: hypothetical protein JWM10_4094 [Myxococcaceae bacterium]|nr:hypothetical protein [Myxococcaceae bacterium]